MSIQTKIKNEVIEVVRITPLIASELLKLNTRNRKISKPAIEKLKREMINGSWRYTGDTITINKNNEITNGQHRLTACYESGVTIKAAIAYGVDIDSFSKQDQNKARTSGVILGYNGVKNASSIGAVCRLLAGASGERLAYMGKEKPEVIYSKLTEQNKEFLQLAYRLTKSKSVSLVAPDNFAAFLLLVSTNGKASAFIKGVSSGEQIGGAALSLRNYRVINKPNGNYKNSQGKAMEVIKAWLTAYAGKRVTNKLVYLSDDSLFDIESSINSDLIEKIKSGK